jgi:hypothetical protein
MLFAVNLFQHQTIKTMAKPIKETPTLTGKDAERFFQRMENLEKVSAEEVASTMRVSTFSYFNN